MKTVLVTGAYGFIGRNLCAELDQNKDITTLRFGRESTDEDLATYVQEADFIFHLAGVNRPKNDKEFKEGNQDLTEKIISLLAKKEKRTPLVITSSTQATQDNAYGLSKKAAEDAVFKWSNSDAHNRVYIFRLPNVFGKWSRPNYNSVVATFCHNISHGLDITVNDPSISLTLVYVDDVIATFMQAMNNELDESDNGFYEIEQKFTATLGEIAEKIHSFKESRQNLVVPTFDSPFNRALYATYTSYLDTDDFDYSLQMNHDDRGWLAEFIKSNQFGQIFVSRTKPGVSRGNHWHHTKIEKFLVINGQADIKFRKIETDEILTYSVTGDDLRVLDIPAGYVHSITNTGKQDLLTIFWADEIFSPDHPDTHYQNVSKELL